MLIGSSRELLKPVRLVLAGMLCLVLLAMPAFAASGQSRQSQSLSLMLNGQIMNAGSQQYEFGGGNLIQGALNGNPLTSVGVHFDIDASVSGPNSASGRGTLDITSSNGWGANGGNARGQSNGGNSNHGKGVNYHLQITITGVVAAAVFPITLDTSTSPPTVINCVTSCTSEIPLLFTGLATPESDGGHDSPPIPIAIESPYWNPFGGPILITSLDGTSTAPPTVFLVVTYDRASIDWDGVQLGGVFSGSLGSETVTGSYGQAVNSQEDLVRGSEFDSGSISFTSTEPTLNAAGQFFGHTTIPSAGSPCPPQFELPPGTCTETGATSSGLFWMNGGHDTFISGTYHTTWSVPSLFTMTTVIGAVSQH